MPGESWVQCYHCGREFRDKFNLKRHVVLHLRPVKDANRICSMCPKTFLSRDDVLQHYMFDHNVEIQPERLDFENFKAFDSWKTKLERREKSVFIKKRGTHINKNGISKMYYWCQRDGFTPQDRQVFGQRKRRLKKTGYNQVNICCPASMKAVVLPDGRVSVNYIATHVGHEAEVERLKLLKSDKTAIAKLIAEGKPFMEILKDFRLRPKEGSDERLRLINLGDLDNIARKFNIKPKNSRRARCVHHCISENAACVGKQCTEQKRAFSEDQFHKKLVELDRMWGDIKTQVTNTKEADLVLNMLFSILTSLQKTPRWPQVLEEQKSRSNLPAGSTKRFVGSEPPPLVFYSDKLTKSNAPTMTCAVGLRSLEPPKLVPMSSRKLTKAGVHSENKSPGVKSKVGTESHPSVKITKPKPSKAVPGEGQSKKGIVVKCAETMGTGGGTESQKVTLVFVRKVKRKISSSSEVEPEKSPQVPPLVPTKSANFNFQRITPESGAIGKIRPLKSKSAPHCVIQGNQQPKPKTPPASSSKHVQLTQRTTRASARHMKPKILRVSRSSQKLPEKTEVCLLPEQKRVEHSYSRRHSQELGQSSALTKVKNLSEPPPLVFLPPKNNASSSDILIRDVRSLASEVESKHCLMLKGVENLTPAKIPPPLPIKVAFNDTRMPNPSEPPKLVLIPSVAQKLIDTKQLCLQGDSRYLIHKMESSN